MQSADCLVDFSAGWLPCSPQCSGLAAAGECCVGAAIAAPMPNGIASRAATANNFHNQTTKKQLLHADAES